MQARLAPEQRRTERAAARDAEMRASAAQVVAAAPPPTEWQLALLARLCRASAARRAQNTHRTAERRTA